MGLTVITGANRGIGYDMARLWKARGNHVIAVCRSSAVKKGGEDLHDLGVRVIEGIDVSRADGTAEIEGNPDSDALVAAVEAEGYTARLAHE